LKNDNNLGSATGPWQQGHAPLSIRGTDSVRLRFGKTENKGLKPISATFRRHSSCLKLKKPKNFWLPKNFQYFRKPKKFSAKPKTEIFSAKPLSFGFSASRNSFGFSVRFSSVRTKIFRIGSVLGHQIEIFLPNLYP